MKKQLLLSLSLLLASCITPDEQVARASVLLNSGQEAEAVGLYRAAAAEGNPEIGRAHV